ncbi:hypothetical protein [Sanyastnella coralliicola]|uniref:hypothetical protein n=1 Tax=Sanyastnella coralliicola TaxID=3069118 RepID=UPI0027B989D8|nr:hypothetical protein [Longitalea sp. SCSIO 12813]
MLRIENPCPLKAFHMKKVEGGHFCGQCQNKVVDIRHMNDEQIQHLVETEDHLCVSAHRDQLTGQHLVKRSLRKRIIFAAASVIAIFGFMPSALAQATVPQKPAKETVTVTKKNTVMKDKRGDEVCVPVIDEDQPKRKYRRRRFGKRQVRGRFRTLGCPSF